MKLHQFFILVICLICSLNIFAHKGGHREILFSKWTINNKNIEASFLTFKDGQVLLETKTGQVLKENLTAFSKENQKIILQRYDNIKSVNYVSDNTTHSINQYWNILLLRKKWILFTLFLGLFLVLYLIQRKKVVATTVMSFLLITVVFACNKETNSDADEESEEVIDEGEPFVTTVPANNTNLLGEHFENFLEVTTSYDDTYFYVSSSGFPEHNMMIGITSWQQQVPTPQNYTGTNSWSIPLQPVLAETPLLASEHFMKGAMAVAVNGIPIFNPLNNRGEDALLFGELDDWGGHCGKADDYHYHVPPTHLESVVGTDKPIAYAFDGFPIYGVTTDELDEYLGKFNEDGSYQYHTTTTAPYFMAAMRGIVSLDPNTSAPEDQIIPQANSTPIRGGDYGPLNGAEITNFHTVDTNSYSLEYQIDGEFLYTNYYWDENGLFTFNYVQADGTVITETY
tara:strand:- start:3119 stop:4483 length:1365 start_codon:yes stop_codon:yes gene_type:complete